MAGDIGIREQAIVLPRGESMAAATVAVAKTRSRVMHVYGPQLVVADVPLGAEALIRESLTASAVETDAADVPPDVRAALSVPERLGLDALSLRQSRAYVSAKAKRKHAGADWDSGVAETPACHDITIGDHDAEPGRATMAGAPTSARLTGSIAVGLILVEGPTAALQLSAAERTKVVAEVQNGLSWYATRNPAAELTFSYDIQIVRLAPPANPSASDLEAVWRNPTMAALGHAANFGCLRLRRRPAEPAWGPGGPTARSSPSTRSGTSPTPRSAGRGW